jgi:hypothetical protein
LVKYVRFSCCDISRAEIDDNTYIGKVAHGLLLCRITLFYEVSALRKYIVAVNICHSSIVTKRFNARVKSPINDLGENHAHVQHLAIVKLRISEDR